MRHMITTSMAKVLIVEDDEVIGRGIADHLTHAGFDPLVVTRGEVGLARLRFERQDVVVLDLMLPGLDGLEVMRRLHERERVSVILLTAKGEAADRIAGLRQGADDYVVKPFLPAELVARVNAVLRRAEPAGAQADQPIAFDGLEIDPRGRRVTVRGEEVQLTVREFDLLLHLMRHPGQVFSRDQLMDAVWQYTFYTDTSTVTVHIRRLRAKVEEDPTRPRRLQTVWGVGYRFQP